MSELSIFVDESGDFGEYQSHSPYVDVMFQTFQLEKRKVLDEVDATGRLSKDISRFVKEHFEFFLSFDVVKIYYDSGQVQVNKMLASVFNALLDNVEFRKVVPSDYRLFQIADLACTLQLIKTKSETKSLSNSERIFFETERILKKKLHQAL